MMICSELALQIVGRIGILVVREDFVKSTLPSFIAIVSVATLKTLELWLRTSQLE
jgi:hypothetical protein